MENSTLLKLWLLTVLLGSLLLCLIGIALLNGAEVIGLWPLFVIISFCSSVPAIIALTILNLTYVKKYKEFKIYRKKLMLAHLYIGLKYVIGGFLFFRYDGVFLVWLL